jgi:hypothetical protein
VSDLRDGLADYIGLLSNGLATASNANDRGLYIEHLAQAAKMFFYLQKKMDRTVLSERLSHERRAYGWSFLPGNDGNAAESAFNRFAKAIEDQSEHL